MNFIKKNATWILTIIVVAILIQSLFFKFMDSSETKYIFEGKLEPWAMSLGFRGLFAPGGIFSAKVVGTFELLTSILLIIGAFLNNKMQIQTLGGLLGIKIISGAIFFHLFTPLGIAVVNTDGSSDGGVLFILSLMVFVCCALIVFLRRGEWLPLIQKIFKK